MTLYTDVDGREFTYNEYWDKIYLDEKRPHVDHLARHKWPEEKPKWTDWYLVKCVSVGTWHEVGYWKDGCFFIDQRCLRKPFNDAIAHWWDLPEATE